MVERKEMHTKTPTETTQMEVPLATMSTQEEGAQDDVPVEIIHTSELEFEHQEEQPPVTATQQQEEQITHQEGKVPIKEKRQEEPPRWR